MVINSAGAYIPEIAAVCLHTVNQFQMPVAANLYITNPRQATSAPPHTDQQDVLALQTSGAKRWRVYAPPEPRKRPMADPFARGKGYDLLSISELTAVPLIDAVLEPGSTLYVPAGFPHTTGTVHEW